MTPDVPMTEPGWQAWTVLALLVVTVKLFAAEKLRVDIVALLGLAALMLLGILPPEEAFAGFGNPVVAMLAAVFVIGAGLQETGVLAIVGVRLVKVLPRGEAWLVLGLMCVAAALSAFMNNTSVTAMLVPLVMGLSRQASVSPARLLMPVAFASIVGGTCTLIGTSTNVAVSGYLTTKAGLAPVGLFETAGIGLVFVAVGILYMVLIGRHMLPSAPETGGAEDYNLPGFLSEIVLLPGSPMTGQRVAASDLARMEFRILKIVRSGTSMVPEPHTVLQEGDVLLVNGDVANLMKVKATEGIEIRPDLKLGAADLRQPGLELAEVVVSPSSNLVGRSLRESRFQQEFRLTVLAIHRLGHVLKDRLSRIRLRAGDLLLVQGGAEALDAVRNRRDLAMLADRGPANPALRKPLLALGIFAGSLAVGGLNLVPMPTAFLVAALSIVLTGCLRAARLYDSVEWRLLVLIGAMMAYGKAMESTGAADLVAQAVVATTGSLGPLAVIAGFSLVTVLLSQPMSNAAAALVVLPVALRAGEQTGIEPRSLALAVMLSASFSVATPLEPSCVLVCGPGKYRFADFVKVGFPLTVILIAVLVWLLPRGWPL